MWHEVTEERRRGGEEEEGGSTRRFLHKKVAGFGKNAKVMALCYDIVIIHDLIFLIGNTCFNYTHV